MKRLSTDEPLTPDDVAERLDRAAMRALRILMDTRQTPDLIEPVKRSRYLTDSLQLLRDELNRASCSTSCSATPAARPSSTAAENSTTNGTQPHPAKPSPTSTIGASGPARTAAPNTWRPARPGTPTSGKAPMTDVDQSFGALCWGMAWVLTMWRLWIVVDQRRRQRLRSTNPHED